MNVIPAVPVVIAGNLTSETAQSVPAPAVSTGFTNAATRARDRAMGERDCYASIQAKGGARLTGESKILAMMAVLTQAQLRGNTFDNLRSYESSSDPAVGSSLRQVRQSMSDASWESSMDLDPQHASPNGRFTHADFAAATHDAQTAVDILSQLITKYPES